MKTQEFAYYLQGYFEINGSDNIISTRMANVLDNKLKKLETAQTDAPQLLEFVGMVKGLLPLLKSESTTNDMRATLSKQIGDQLNNAFVHAIDPSYAGDQNQFNQTHSGGKKPTTDLEPGMRC